MDDYRKVVNHDIKRILAERDITTIKQAFFRILCSETRNNNTRIFIPHKLFSQDRLQSYLSNKELGFGRQVFESEDYIVYNTILKGEDAKLYADAKRKMSDSELHSFVSKRILS
ncbi:MAG: hypothetical protein ACJ72Q_19085 [Nitrososphaeraceae archaeon]